MKLTAEAGSTLEPHAGAGILSGVLLLRLPLVLRHAHREGDGRFGRRPLAETLGSLHNKMPSRQCAWMALFFWRINEAQFPPTTRRRSLRSAISETPPALHIVFAQRHILKLSRSIAQQSLARQLRTVDVKLHHVVEPELCFRCGSRERSLPDRASIGVLKRAIVLPKPWSTEQSWPAAQTTLLMIRLRLRHVRI